MTELNETITTKELAEILGKVKTSILRRAKLGDWPYENGKNRIRRFLMAGLPEDVRMAVMMNQRRETPPIPLSEWHYQNRGPFFVLPRAEILQAEIRILDEQMKKIHDQKWWRLMCLSEIEETKNEGA